MGPDPPRAPWCHGPLLICRPLANFSETWQFHIDAFTQGVTESQSQEIKKMLCKKADQPWRRHQEMSDRPQAAADLLKAKHQRKGDRGQSLGAKDDVHPRVGDNSLAQFTHLFPMFLIIPNCSHFPPAGQMWRLRRASASGLDQTFPGRPPSWHCCSH